MPTALHTLLLPELEAELAITRRMLAVVPDDKPDFKCHDKSMSLTKLAGHVAEIPGFTIALLTSPDIDLGAPSDIKPLRHVDSATTLAAFDHGAASLTLALTSMSDEAFEAPFNLVYGEYKIFSGTRYAAYRTFGINHLIHHRAQLGVYIRLMGIALPKTYGPSADEM
jgi:uncharacterized damage-inducible protein DinB